MAVGEKRRIGFGEESGIGGIVFEKEEIGEREEKREIIFSPWLMKLVFEI